MRRALPAALSSWIAFCLLASQANAAPLVFAFSGTVTRIELDGSVLDGSVGLGTRIIGTYRLDDERVTGPGGAAYCRSGPFSGRLCSYDVSDVEPYGPNGLRISVGSYRFAPSFFPGPGGVPLHLTLMDAGEGDEAASESWSLFFAPLEPYALLSLSVEANRTGLLSDAAVATLPDLAMASVREGTLGNWLREDGSVTLRFSLDSLTAVPEPGTGVLVGAALAFLGGRRRLRGTLRRTR